MISNLSLLIDTFGLCILVIICITSEIPSQILLSFPKKETSNNRSQSVDFIRGLAITGIVFIHVNSYYQYFGPYESASSFTLFLSNLSRFGVPAFILSSGIFLKFTNWKDYWKPKLISFLIPYLGVSFLASYIKLGTFPELVEFFKGVLLGTWCAPYYFVPLLVLFYGIFYFLNLFISNLKSSKVVLTFFLIVLLINFLSNHFFDYVDNPVLKSIEPILPTGFFFFFIFGMFAGKWFKEPKNFLLLFEKPGPLSYSFSRILLCGILFYLVVVGIVGYFWKFDSSNHLIFYPIAMFLFLFFWAENSQENNKHKRFISVFAFIGKNSMGIFFLHPILIHLMHALNPFDWGAWPLIFIVEFLNVIVPLVTWLFFTKTIHWVLQKIKIF
ncbi:acyltransferase family protein [Leptospira noguchii]|uniref:Acyltransferase n=1 Tax=Leptospira noguchii serovar Autumnalis str. ZUN142 TaxID=1085540 RepID=M6UB91_9LEPT|nr:acyltransferase [Leptospira noguchii]EMO42307.1 acyltransferase [Leptospira noguchii serovar Autumnalis str. ZUN142]UOG50695.1 acyltransferase [Leptospira noguchii]